MAMHRSAQRKSNKPTNRRTPSKKKKARTACCKAYAPKGPLSESSAPGNHILFRVISISQICLLARLSGFCIRMRRVHPVQWLLTLCEQVMHGYVSLNDFAARLDRNGVPITRQGLACKCPPRDWRSARPSWWRLSLKRLSGQNCCPTHPIISNASSFRIARSSACPHGSGMNFQE